MNISILMQYLLSIHQISTSGMDIVPAHSSFIRVNYIYSATFNFMFANCLKIKNLNSIFLFFSFLIKTILINFIFLIMIIGLIDNHSPALTPQEMSDFDQMDSIGEYSGDEVSFTPISPSFRLVSPFISG